jgi:hypothetical protein
MIGDRLDTDVAMGKQGGLVTLLPLTGRDMVLRSMPPERLSQAGTVQHPYCSPWCVFGETFEYLPSTLHYPIVQWLVV